MLVVVAIMAIVMMVAIPAFSTLSRANDFTTAVSGVSGMLERARTYAMANNVYVYVGIAEVSADVPASTVPQVAATTSVGGRLAMAAVVVREGTRGYTLLPTLPSPAWGNYNKGSDLVAVGKLEVFENVHLAAFTHQPPTTGSMARPSTTSLYQLGDPTCTSVTPFAWPLGSDLASDQCQYYFQKVIQFDPQGTARIQYASNQDNIVQWMEIGLQQSYGSYTPPMPATDTGAIAAILVDGLTGAIRIYRP